MCERQYSKGWDWMGVNECRQEHFTLALADVARVANEHAQNSNKRTRM